MRLFCSMSESETSDMFSGLPRDGPVYRVGDTTEQFSSQTLMGSMKRPLTTSANVNINHSSVSKRCRRNSLSSSDREGSEVNNAHSLDSETVCSSDNSSSFSSYQHQSCLNLNLTEPRTGRDSETAIHNQQRLIRTTKMLKESGLYDVAVRTAALIRQNQQSLKELEELKKETKIFMEGVLNNPENLKLKQVLNKIREDDNISQSFLV